MVLNYLGAWLTTKRGIFLILFVLIINSLFSSFLVGMSYFGRLLSDNAFEYVSTSEINNIRLRAQTGCGFHYWFMVALVYEGAYLFKQQLFHRYMLNGYSRVQWGHFLLWAMATTALILAIVQGLFINAMGWSMFGHQLGSVHLFATLGVLSLQAGVFGLLIVATFPHPTAPFVVFGWWVLELIITKEVIRDFLGPIPDYLPLESLDRWARADEFSLNTSVPVVLYFSISLIVFYSIIKRKSYA